MTWLWRIVVVTVTLLTAGFSSTVESKKPSSSSPRAKKKQHALAVCAIFRNEARFLVEWIEFHKLMGASRFYLYNNLSEDHYREVLAPYIESGEVELEEWPYSCQTSPETGVAPWTKIQTDAYNHAIAKATDKVKWLAILDTDEFLYPVKAENLVSYLADFEGHGGVVAHWQLFGTSHVRKIPDGSLMIETLTLKAHDGYAENGYVKSIVRPERVRTIDDPHFAHYLPPYAAVNQNGDPVPASLSPIVVDKLRINHYWSRDEEFFYSVKVPRREGWLEGLAGQLQRLENINQIEDRVIWRFIPSLRKRMGLPTSEIEVSRKST